MFRTPAFIRLIAMVCLLALWFQVLGIGHWGGGHQIVTPDEAAEHAAHCHGDKSSCGSGASAAADVAATFEAILPGPSLFALETSLAEFKLPEHRPDVPDDPPRGALPAVVPAL